MRVKSARRSIEKLIEESYVIVVVTQQWNQNLFKLWYQTNVELLKFNHFFVEKNEAFVEEIISLRELIDVLQNVIDDLMTSTFIAFQNLVNNTLTSSVTVDCSDDEIMIHENVNYEDNKDSSKIS